MKLSEILPPYHELKSKVLAWLSTLKVEGREYDYKFSKDSGYSLFTTCFALYILDMFRETDTLSKAEKEGWAAYINSYQNEKDGLFYPDPIYHPDEERAVFQVTSFCLSALHILEREPKYRLAIVDQWKTKEAVEDYLMQRGVHLGKGGSGNKAMFQAIFLTHEYEKTKDEILLNSIEAWFDFHDKHQNEQGFWGSIKTQSNTYYGGLQNGFHQFVIYEYWNRAYPKLEKVFEIIPKIQDYEGHFAPYPGGGACKDYDAIHYFMALYSEKNTSETNKIINKSIKAISKSWKKDGGFYENGYKPYKIGSTAKILNFIVSQNLSITKYRLKETIKEVIKKKRKKSRKWVEESQKWNESTLWDTWFRCLSLAEISNICKKPYPVKYLKHIGIGYSRQ